MKQMLRLVVLALAALFVIGLIYSLQPRGLPSSAELEGLRSYLSASSPWHKSAPDHTPADALHSNGDATEPDKLIDVLDHPLADGEPMAPPLGNATLKAELGRAGWRLFHTTLARLPVSITSPEARADLEGYVLGFARYYPCGDCSRHFQQLLKKYPPQTSGRVAASLWGCRVHNEVNKRLKKQEYDCTGILADYDCGCGDEKNATQSVAS